METCSAIRVKRLRNRLLTWGEKNIKDYPWRYIDDPYAVLVAAFMLHKTQADQVQPVYEIFMTTYPTLSDFARANKQKVADLLYPLGLHHRILTMIDALQELWESYNKVPTNFEDLLPVKGIGSYIAGATICFSRNQCVALVDTNTVRVTGRIYGLDLSGEARRRKSVINAISEACAPSNPRSYYYAMIDLAHTICTPRNPSCTNCPLLDVACEFGKTRISEEV